EHRRARTIRGTPGLRHRHGAALVGRPREDSRSRGAGPRALSLDGGGNHQRVAPAHVSLTQRAVPRSEPAPARTSMATPESAKLSRAPTEVPTQPTTGLRRGM